MENAAGDHSRLDSPMRLPTAGSGVSSSSHVSLKMAKDRDKPIIPVFGLKTGLAGRTGGREEVLAASFSPPAESSSPPDVSSSKVEQMLREKMKTGYYTFKQAFGVHDPEGRGFVNRESFRTILTMILGFPVSLPLYNKVLTRLGLVHLKTISTNQLLMSLQGNKKADNELPSWLELKNNKVQKISAEQAWKLLRKSLSTSLENVIASLPRSGLDGVGSTVLKPELRYILAKLDCCLDDIEYEKLWLRLNPQGAVALPVEELFKQLQPTRRNESTEGTERKPSRHEAAAAGGGVVASNADRLRQGLEAQVRKEYASFMHAFLAMDAFSKGTVPYADVVRVFEDFGIKTNSKSLEKLLKRLGVSSVNGQVRYQDLLHKLNDSSLNGCLHKLLSQNPDRSFQDTSTTITSVTHVEMKLATALHSNFLSLLQSFRSLDRHRTGLLSLTEFRALLETRFRVDCSDAEWREFLSTVPMSESGHVKYTELLHKLNDRQQSEFDPRLDLTPCASEESDTESLLDEVSPRPLNRNDQSRVSRNPDELHKIIRNLVRNRLEDLQLVYQELDTYNTKHITKDMFQKLLRRLGEQLTSEECGNVWGAYLKDRRGKLEFWQLLRHYSHAGDSSFDDGQLAAGCRGGDNLKRSRRLQNDSTLLEDQLRLKAQLNDRSLVKELQALDKENTGFVPRHAFKEIIHDLCVQLTDQETENFCDRYDLKGDGRVYWKQLFSTSPQRANTYRPGDHVTEVLSLSFNDSILNKSDQELASKTQRRSPRLGLESITAKIREQLAGDWRHIRRAFNKLDISNDGYLSVEEFRSVLKLINVMVEDDEIYKCITELNSDQRDRVPYKDFLQRTMIT